MRPNEYHVILENFPTESGKVPLRLAGKLSERILGLAAGVVRLNFEGRSDRPGKQPEWVKAATEVSWTAIEGNGKTGLSLEAPQLGDVLIGNAYQGFFQEMLAPGDVMRESALSLAIEAMQQATGAHASPSTALVDRGVLHQIQRFTDLFPPGNTAASLLIHNESPSSRVVINRQVLRDLNSNILTVPAPEPVRIAGMLEAMQFSAADARVIVGNRKIKVHIPTSLLKGLGQFFGHEVLVHGVANFNAEGQVTSIEASNVEAASGQQLALFGQVPISYLIQPALDFVRRDQNYKNNDAARRRAIAREMNIEEDFDDLLKQLRDINS